MNRKHSTPGHIMKAVLKKNMIATSGNLTFSNRKLGVEPEKMRNNQTPKHYMN